MIALSCAQKALANMPMKDELLASPIAYGRRTADSSGFEHGQSEPRSSMAISVVEHEALTFVVENEGVFYHFGIPARRGDINGGIGEA